MDLDYKSYDMTLDITYTYSTSSIDLYFFVTTFSNVLSELNKNTNIDWEKEGF